MDIEMEVIVSGSNGNVRIDHRGADRNIIRAAFYSNYDADEVVMSDSELLDLKRAIDKIITACDIT